MVDTDRYHLFTGYAADGYAKIIGISALITKFGVGELSAANAIAGAFSENAPVVHIVGAPATNASPYDNLCAHSSLDSEGDGKVFSTVARLLTCDSVVVDNASTAADLIDGVLKQCWLQGRPVYIVLPEDMAEEIIDGVALDCPIDLQVPLNDENAELAMVSSVLERLRDAQKPMIIVDNGIPCTV